MKFRTGIFLTLCYLVIRTSTGEAAPPLPTAYPDMDIVIADTTLVSHYLRTANAKINAGEPDSAETYFRLATQLARRLNDYAREKKSMERHVAFLHRQLKFDEALEICEHILASATAHQDESGIANSFNNMGVLYQAMGKLQTAAEYYIKALDLAEKNMQNENQAKFNSNLASIFIDLSDKEKALHYATKGYAIAVKMKDSVRISNSLVNLSVSETINELYDDAIRHLHQMIEIAARIKNQDRVLDGYINLGDIFIKQKQYKAALDILLKAKNGLRAPTPPDYALYIYHGLSLSYFHLQDFDQALYYYEKLFPDIENSFPRNELKDIYLFGAELYEELGSYQQALAWQKKYNALRDSLLDAASLSDIQELELKYQKTLTQKTLAEQQLVIAKHEHAIERKNKIIVLVVGAILMLITIVIIVLILHFARQRTLKNEQRLKLLKAQMMGEEKERSRQARELHDGVSGLLAAAKIHLASITIPEDSKANYAKVLSLLHKANNEVRDISHNLAPQIVLEHGLHHAIADFVSRISHPRVEIRFSVIGELPRMKAELELLVYRAVQESLNNIIKHSRASTAMVQISCLEAILTVTIEDDGVGFDHDNTASKGLGLSNLAARIHGVKGVFDISSSPGNGTTIYFEMNITRYSLPSPANVPLHVTPVLSN